MAAVSLPATLVVGKRKEGRVGYLPTVLSCLVTSLPRTLGCRLPPHPSLSSRGLRPNLASTPPGSEAAREKKMMVTAATSASSGKGSAMPIAGQ